ncbi:MAG: RsmD family RNA methyltransferase [Micrococcales bacterium]|nr:RsmD family RNA methyltransferase [Micrococcales bacterium]
MTRIIGGFAGSLALRSPTAGTRPTTDRVREAVFGALDAQDAVRGARVLDLYSGTGALGLEAAPRGAAAVTLVDRVHGAVRVGKENAALVRRAAPRGAVPEIVVTSSPVQTFLGGSLGEWDLVFLDPPYELGPVELGHNLAALVPRLSTEAVVVVERSARDAPVEPPEGLELVRRRDYGETAIYYLAPSQSA